MAGYYPSFFPPGHWVSMKNYSSILTVNVAGGGYMILDPPDDLNATVNVHLMPGKIASI